MPATDANYDGFQILPDAQGTILLKTQTRPPGCPTEFNGAMSSCQQKYGAQPDTTVIAANPLTLKNEAAIKLNQEVTTRPVVTTWHGKIYAYIEGSSTLIRVRWNPASHTLTQDTSWAPKYLLKGQEGGDAPAIIGQWAIANTNAEPSSTTPICAVAVSQANPNNLHRICPWGTKLPSGVKSSESPASFSADPANSMFFMQDWFVKGVFAVRINQSTGAMNVVWSRPDWRSSDYFSIIGPTSQRVVISQYLDPGWKMTDLAGNNYTESVLWVNEKTGKTIAESAFNGATAQGSLPNVGYGGRLYMMGLNGALYIYQVVPCSNKSAAAAVPASTTTCSTNYSSLPQPVESPKLPPQPSGG
jgi:hypothetical protein